MFPLGNKGTFGMKGLSQGIHSSIPEGLLGRTFGSGRQFTPTINKAVDKANQPDCFEGIEALYPGRQARPAF
jgi:hypothetical protein